MDRAILFDMDGLLLDTERVAQAAFRDALAPLSVSQAFTDALFLELVGGSGASTRARVQSALPGCDYEALDRAWTQSFTDRLAADVPVKPGVFRTIEALAGAGYSMAVVTSTRTAHAEDHLRRCGLRGFFGDVVGGDVVWANKPDPAPYRAGASAVGVPAQRCFAFEDSDRGVAAAIAAGCQTWQIPDLRPTDRPLPELGQSVAPTLAEAVTRAGLL